MSKLKLKTVKLLKQYSNKKKEVGGIIGIKSEKITVRKSKSSFMYDIDKYISFHTHSKKTAPPTGNDLIMLLISNIPNGTHEYIDQIVTDKNGYYVYSIKDKKVSGYKGLLKYMKSLTPKEKSLIVDDGQIDEGMVAYEEFLNDYLEKFSSDEVTDKYKEGGFSYNKAIKDYYERIGFRVVFNKW
jgi:hypothetical protein